MGVGEREEELGMPEGAEGQWKAMRQEERGGYIYGVPILAPKSIAASAYFLSFLCARFESSGEEMGVGRNTM